LRDACRNSEVVSSAAGERLLGTIPWVTRSQGVVKVVESNLEEVKIHWADENAVSCSTFTSNWLRQYAPIVAKDLCNDSAKQVVAKESHLAAREKFKWLEPYYGYPGNKAPTPESVTLWKNHESTKGDHFQHRSYADVCGSEAKNLEMMQALMRHGVVIIDDVPTDLKTNSTVLSFANNVLGGMQKDPARDEPNWVIQAKDAAQSVSYNQPQRLNNHSDQSIPAHGIPALLLVVHYVQGTGCNTLVDSYAVARAMKERNPEAYRLLSTYGNNQERDFVRSRVDSTQKGTQSMLIPTKQPILQLDAEGNHFRTQFNEVFRTPSTIPFEDFEKWYDAYLLWNDMIHGPEFEVEVPINEGQILILDNWRVLHGRAAKKSSPDRVIMGGTVVREAFLSRAISLLGAHCPTPDAASSAGTAA